jgi:hypothetical protein
MLSLYRALFLLGFAFVSVMVSGGSMAADDWYDDIRKVHRKEIYRLEVNWILNDGSQCDLPAMGTAFLFSPRGHIVTATHVVDRAKRKPGCLPEITAYPDAGSSIHYKTRIIPSLSDDKVTLLQLVGFQTDTSLRAGDSRLLKENDQIFYMGYPGGAWSWNVGKITNLNDPHGLYLVEMSSAGGASGSPVFDKCGAVVGVIMGRPDPANAGQTHFVPIALVPDIAAVALPAPACASERPLQKCRVLIEAATNTVVTRSTGWRGGGYSPQQWCSNLLSTVAADNPTATATLVANSAIENTRDACRPFNCREYNYTCSVRVHKEAKYAEQMLPTCP